MTVIYRPPVPGRNCPPELDDSLLAQALHLIAAASTEHEAAAVADLIEDAYFCRDKGADQSSP